MASALLLGTGLTYELAVRKSGNVAYRLAAGVALAAAFLLIWVNLAVGVIGSVDFAVASALLLGTGLTYELAVRKSGNVAYRLAAGVALAAAFLLIWVNLAVGVIASGDEPANLLYGAVLAVGIIGAILVRFEPQGMARAPLATAIAQALVGMLALGAGWERHGAALAAALHARGIHTHAWVINSRDEFSHFAGLGVAAVTTDRPDILCAGR